MEDGFVDVSAILRTGVYLVVHQGKVVYVGQARVMLGRLYKHRVAWGSKSKKRITALIPPKGMLFDQVFVRPCLASEMDGLEQELIRKYKPKHNTRHNASVPPELTGLVARIVASRGGSVPTQPKVERRGF